MSEFHVTDVYVFLNLGVQHFIRFIDICDIQNGYMLEQAKQAKKKNNSLIN